MKKVQTHVKYGGITGAAIVILGLILYVADLSFKPGMNYVAQLPFLIGIILNAMAYSKANDQYVTFGNVFSSGIKASLIVTVISLVWTFLALLIFPEMKDKAIEISEQALMDQNMSDEQIEMGMGATKKFFTLFMVLGVLFGTMFWGAIFSLIGGAIAKKKPQGMPQA